MVCVNKEWKIKRDLDLTDLLLLMNHENNHVKEKEIEEVQKSFTWAI